MCVRLFLILLLAHVVGDFYCQNGDICTSKKDRHFASIWAYLHPLVVACISGLFVWNKGFVPYALLIMVTHFVVDMVKSYCKDTVAVFVIDQILHVTVLIMISCMWGSGEKLWIDCASFAYIRSCFVPEYALALLTLGKPSNILIKKILEAYKLQERGTNKIGSLIGSLERVIAFLLIAAGQFSAVGFLVTAKSVLRFKDTQTEKTEYVLAGTLLSFGIAIVIGILVYHRVLWAYD